MRKFTGLLFLGAGRFSVRERFRLHARLDEALDLSGALQQPQHWEHEPSPAERAAHEAQESGLSREVQDSARDISAALTGRDISFGEVLPPGNALPMVEVPPALAAVEEEFIAELRALGAKYLGAGGRVPTLLRGLAEQPPEERRVNGEALNNFVARVNSALRSAV